MEGWTGKVEGGRLSVAVIGHVGTAAFGCPGERNSPGVFLVPEGPPIIARHFSGGCVRRNDARAESTPETDLRRTWTDVSRPYGTSILPVPDPALKRLATIRRSYGTRILRII